MALCVDLDEADVGDEGGGVAWLEEVRQPDHLHKDVGAGPLGQATIAPVTVWTTTTRLLVENTYILINCFDFDFFENFNTVVYRIT